MVGGATVVVVRSTRMMTGGMVGGKQITDGLHGLSVVVVVVCRGLVGTVGHV